MPQPLIIFDLDGTLANTGPDLLATLNRICSPYDIPPLTQEELNYSIGQGARAMIEKTFLLAGKKITPILTDELLEKFLIDYEENICVDTHLFDGVLEAMDKLESKGYVFAVCTNKSEYLARILLDELNVTKRFKSITGGDSFEFRKPDERHLEETAKLAGTDLSNAIMIGDSKADIQAALNAAIPSVAVTFGYTDIPVEELGASQIIDHFKLLPQAIGKITKVEA